MLACNHGSQWDHQSPTTPAAPANLLDHSSRVSHDVALAAQQEEEKLTQTGFQLLKQSKSQTLMYVVGRESCVHQP